MKDRNKRKMEKGVGRVLRKNLVIISLAIMLLSIIPASAIAISCDAQYSVQGFNLGVDTTYVQGDVMYNNLFVGASDALSFTQAEVSFGSDFSIEQSGLALFTHPGQSWTKVQSMTNGYEDATIETRVEGHDTLASFSDTSSMTDLEFSCSVNTQTPASDETETNDVTESEGVNTESSGVDAETNGVTESDNGYTLVEQIGYGYEPGKPPRSIHHRIYVMAPGKISTRLAFLLEQIYTIEAPTLPTIPGIG